MHDPVEPVARKELAEPRISSETKRVAVIAGDGIGPEVVAVGLRIIQALDLPVEFEALDLGAERFLRDGATFPEPERTFITDECDAVLLGALGDPRIPDLSYARDLLFGLRFGLDLFCNVRPIQCLDDRLMPLANKSARDCDMVVFRENTEGSYVGVGGNVKKDSLDEIAITEDINTRKGVERILRAAFDYARLHGRRRVTMSDKHNAMPHAHGLWKRTFELVRHDYPDIESEHRFVDALCLQMIRSPESLDVIVTNNLFGDILTDLGAGLQGGLGMAASANIHPGRRPTLGTGQSATPRCSGLFEPVHGSAPDLVGTQKANPLATILTLGAMCRHFGWPDCDARLTELVRRCVVSGPRTPDIGGDATTPEVESWLLDELAS